MSSEDLGQLVGALFAGISRVTLLSLGLFGAMNLGSQSWSEDAPVPAQQSKNAGSEAGPVNVDKSPFTLFNPVTDAEMRPFSTDRPGKTHSSLTVDAGHFQLEGDFWNYTWDGYTKDHTTIRAHTFINPNLKLGITNWGELDIFLPLYNTLNVRNRDGGRTTRAHGFGDVLLGGKVNFFGNDGGDQAFAAIGFVKLPTAAPGLGNNMVEYALNFPFTTTLPQKFSLTVEPAVGVLRNLIKQGYQGDYQFLINLNRPIIGDTVIAALELALDFPGDHNIGPRHTIDPSLQWLLTSNLQLDVGVYIGLTKGAPDWNPYVGISFRY